MLKELRTVTTDACFEDNYFPSIIQYAGQSKAPGSVVVMFDLAFREFEKKISGLPTSCQSALKMNLLQYIPEFIKAILHDSIESKEAVSIWYKTR